MPGIQFRTHYLAFVRVCGTLFLRVFPMSSKRGGSGPFSSHCLSERTLSERTAGLVSPEVF